MELVERYIHTEFPRLGIRFISLIDNADTDDKGNKKSRQINALVNEWFLEELSDSIKSVLTSRREQGLHIGAFAPYGYAKDPNAKGHLIIDEEAAAVVRRIFLLYLAGKGKQLIARTLNEEGIPNPTEYKRLHGMVRNKKMQCSPLWSYFTITSILTNEVYIGNMIQGKSGVESYKTQQKVVYPSDQWIVVTGTHDPIIDQENEWYLEDMSDNIRSVLTSRRENGFHIGAFAPYGYKKDPDVKGHLIIDEESAEIVRDIFNLFSDGYGKTAIARQLNERGVPNPTEYKRRKGFRYTQSMRAATPLWKYHSIQWILSNEVYIGNLVQGRFGSVSYKTKQIKSLPKEQWIKVEGTHEPIIELELWNRVQKKINSSARTNPSTGKIHTFSKIAVCMHCGYAMRVHKCHGHYYLQCETKSISKAACPGAFIPEAELEQIVIDELRKFNHYLLDQSTLERKVEFDYVMNSKKSKLLSEKKRYQEKVEECNIALQQLYIDKAAGIITPKAYVELSSTFQTDKSRYEIIITSCDDQIREVDSYLRLSSNHSELLVPYVKVEQLNRRMIETLIDRIEIGKRNRETGLVPVSIFWNF